MARKTTPLLNEALVQYQTVRKTYCARNTVLNDQSVLSRFVRGVGNPQVHRLSQEAVERYFTRISRKQAPSSYNKTRTRVRGFLAFCSGRSWLTSDPLVNVRTQRVRQVERERLTASQLLAMVDSASDPRDRAMIATAVNTGLRVSDLTSMRVGHVDLAKSELFVDITKSGVQDRLPITSDLEVELRAWLTLYAESIGRRRLAKDSFLFPARTAPKWADPTSNTGLLLGDLLPSRQVSHAARIVHRSLRAIGVEVRSQQGWHTIRRSVGRTFFDMSAERGHDAALRMTAALLHHKNTATTELYLGIDADRKRRDALLKGRPFLSALVDQSNVSSISNSKRRR